jgi:restriction system protein
VDVTHLFLPIFNAFWWLIPLLILSGIFQSVSFKGNFGEFLVRFSANLLLDKEKYKAIHNVTLPTPDGTTQIDHIFVSTYGIFVVETKNYAGWIFGDEQHATWTQKIYRNTYKFQNPLRQNFKHVKALEATLKFPAESFHSVIVFTGGSTFKTPMPANVTYAGGLIRYIKSKKQTIFSESEIASITQTIESNQLKPSSATHRDHVRQLKSKRDPETSRLCPKCGNQMVLRTAKTGAYSGKNFWGCSQFPKCRIIQNTV